MHVQPAADTAKGTTWSDRICTVLASLTIAATMSSLLARSSWLAEILANLRVQQMIGLAILIAWSSILRRRRLAIVLAFCAALHLPWFVASSRARALDRLLDTSVQTPDLTVTSANVLIGNEQFEAVEEAILAPQADVLAVLELDSLLQSRLASRLPALYPHRHELPRDEDGFGIGLYSREPLQDLRVVDLGGIFRGLAARIVVRDHSYRIVAVHTMPPIGSGGAALRNEHLQRTAAFVRELEVQEPDCPVVLMGDLNVTPWSPHFRLLEDSSQLRRAARGSRLTPTWHCLPAYPFGLVLDHVLISDSLQCLRTAVGPPMGSDHRTITAELHFRPPASSRSQFTPRPQPPAYAPSVDLPRTE
jgi:endonuclease/exonuclease/phosphatase (EEP) superfamily protein YafD